MSLSRTSTKCTATALCAALFVASCISVAVVVVDATKAIVVDGPPCVDASKRFDAVGLECRACPQGKIVSTSGDQCVCPVGTVLALADSSTSSQRVETCLSCDQWFTRFPSVGNTTVLTPASDGLQCISCGMTASLTGYTNPTLSGGLCTCPAGFATVEVGRGELLVSEILSFGTPPGTALPINAKMCVQCPADTIIDPLRPHVCSRCEYPKVRSSSNTCVCPVPLPTGALCSDETTTLSSISSALNINLNGLESITYYNVPSITTGIVQAEITVTPSPLFEKYGVWSATSCYLNSGTAQNNTACNTLGNICVLNMYDPASAACTLFDRLFVLRSERYHTETSPSLPWAVSLPWLTYEGQAEFILKSRDLLAEVSFVAAGAGSTKVHELKLVLSAYAMNGEWLGFRNFTSQFQLCGAGQGEIDDWLRVGTNYINACEISLENIIEKSRDYMETNGEPIFYDPYIVDALDRLYPIPVYVRNYRDASDFLINQDGSFLNDILVRRFFMTDIATTMGDSEHYMRYAKSMKIVVNLRPDAENNIFPPYIDIEYADRQLPVATSLTAATSTVASASSTQVDILLSALAASTQNGLNVITKQYALFQMIYTSDLDKFRELWQILLILHLIFGSLMFSFRIAAYMRKRRNHALDALVMVQVIVEGCFSFGVVFFLMCFEVATYWFCFFKLQQDVYTFLPGDDDFKEFQVLLTVGTIGISISFAHVVFMQCCQDIFFIDWEKNKMTLTASGAKEFSPVSAWRTIFISNEYNEIQSVRITNVELTALLTVFLLEGTSLKHLSTITPAARDSEGHFYSEQSKMLRFFIASILLLAISGVQYLVNRGLVYRFVKHPLHQFLDLLSLSNHSVLILSSPYAGHYLHGRSTMPFTDVDMEHIIGQLRQECERSSGQPRGLVSTHDKRELADNQVFEIYVTPELRGKYDQLFLRHIQSHYSRRRHVSQDGLLGAVVRRIEHVDDNIVKAHSELSSILRNFINQVEQNPESYVREQYFIQKLFRLPPDMFTINQPLFYHDLSLGGFATNVFLGIEFHHIVLDTFIFCAIDSALENYVISGFVMYAIAKAFKMVRNTFGEINLAKKCLIDSRFLI